MTIAIGTKLGPYEIVAALGAGGMGEVYRARDTRLDREVAIKVLPSRLTDNAEFRQRFEREARAISNLTHPNICTLHDVGHQDGIEYLVMEYIEGETLAARLAKGALGVADTLRIGAEIASALDRAHRADVVHRDLKPGNVMLTKAGAKLLDFGLAKSTAVLDSDPSAVTVTQPLTSKGTIVGTFQYMAPEQLEGREADARTDIFAFGALLYEMATGRRAFEGGSRASLIASIMASEPRAISEIQPMTPPALEHLVRTCLAKDPDDRIQSAHDVRLQLRWIAEHGSAEAAQARSHSLRREIVAWSLVMTSAIFGMAMTVAYLKRPATKDRTFRAFIPAPESTSFISVGYGPREGGPVSISPDGTMVTFLARDATGREQLWVRSLDSSTARPLAGTENSSYPFWSPDSATIGFFADGKLKKIEAAGGPPVSICDAPSGRGGTWNTDGVIVFAPVLRGPLHRVSAGGGPSVPVTTFDEAAQEDTHRWPFFLPDGQHFLYFLRFAGGTVARERNAIMLGSLDGTVSRRLTYANSNAVYASGHMLYVDEGTLVARPFREARLAFTGNAFPVAEQIQYDPGYSRAVFSASTNGVLIYQSGSEFGRTYLAWTDREGKEIATVGDRALYFAPDLSPDGQRAALVIDNRPNAQADVWIIDVASGNRTRFTFDPGNDVAPMWSPDGRQIVFASDRDGPMDLYRKPVAGLGEEELILSSDRDKYPTGWSPDGLHLLFDVGPALGGRGTRPSSDVGLLTLGDDRQPSYFLQDSHEESYAVFSPDGRWIAYQSDGSGQDEVYVTSFPGPGRKWQVSTAGGVQPTWRKDGEELFYISLDSQLMAVGVSVGEKSFESGQVTALFDLTRRAGGIPYAAAADGERFLVIKDVVPKSSALTLVINWTAELKKE